MSDPGFLKYQSFIEAHREANPQIKKEEQLRAAQALWKSVKKEPEKLHDMMSQFKEKAKNREKKMLSFWNKFPTVSSSKTTKPANVVQVQKPAVVVQVPDPPNTYQGYIPGK